MLVEPARAPANQFGWFGIGALLPGGATRKLKSETAFVVQRVNVNFCQESSTQMLNINNPQSPQPQINGLVQEYHSLTQADLKEVLDYSPDSGLFTWKVSTGKAKVGKRAGTILTKPGGQQYVLIQFNRERYLAHRLAFLWMLGVLPEHVVDHRDGDGVNNCWSNLRAATHAQNSWNMASHPRSLSGLKGVRTLCNGTFVAAIMVNRKTIYLGSFRSAQEAHAAYCVAAKKYHGEFARVS